MTEIPRAAPKPLFVKTILLNSLPAGGKSETRKYLKQLGVDKCSEEFRIGKFVQLDDYPYVDIMRQIDNELHRRGINPIFFELPDRGFISDYDWGTLTHLINEDYHDLVSRPPMPRVNSAARWMFERIDRARDKVGIMRKIGDMSANVVWMLADKLEERCASFMHEKWADIPLTLEDRTVIIEFSRGGAHGMEFPLPAPLGYQYTYQLLSSEILANAAILYIHVTPEQSRTKNKERGMELPGNVASSIGAQIMHSLNHSVPEFVMWNAYGRDDIFDLIMRRMSVYYLPIAVFNNADKDLTSFCRKNTAEWKEEEKAELHAELTRSFKGLLEQYMRLNGPDDG